MDEYERLKIAIVTEIVNPILLLLFALALVYFLWGVFRYLRDFNTNPAERKTGQSHMLWGAIGMGIMFSVYGIMNFVFNTVTDQGRVQGIDPSNPNGGKVINRPDVIIPGGELHNL